MNDELLSVLEHIEREKGIKKEVLFQAIEAALISAARKVLGKKDTEGITAKIDHETCEIKIYNGDEEIRSAEFGRISAQTAKQVIIQKIREAERDVIFEDYTERIGTLVSGNVHRFERGAIVVDLGKTEAVLPRREQCQKERYRQGERIRGYILRVERTPKGPEIVLSRTHPGLVKRLFEIEVPEISDGIVEIKGIAREAGERSKIAVSSKEEKVDAVGACVGMRGSRVKNVVKELYGERVDIVRWNSEIKEFVKAAISPAEVAEVRIDTDTNRIELMVENDQLSLAIGKHGQNVRLASKLVGCEIDIRSKVDAKEKEALAKKLNLSKLAGVGKKTAEDLKKAGFDTVPKIAAAKAAELLGVPGVGAKTAEKLVASAKEMIADISKKMESIKQARREQDQKEKVEEAAKEIAEAEKAEEAAKEVIEAEKAEEATKEDGEAEKTEEATKEDGEAEKTEEVVKEAAEEEKAEETTKEAAEEEKSEEVAKEDDETEKVKEAKKETKEPAIKKEPETEDEDEEPQKDAEADEKKDGDGDSPKDNDTKEE
ncbi:MAG: transcription termination/antitermination protein NusA [Candidatus Omnitrophica bacterium]|nr:transcription termination/antitermination protein NusA [Candidatus Omnitrophota bacterium]